MTLLEELNEQEASLQREQEFYTSTEGSIYGCDRQFFEYYGFRLVSGDNKRWRLLKPGKFSLSVRLHNECRGQINLAVNLGIITKTHNENNDDLRSMWEGGELLEQIGLDDHARQGAIKLKTAVNATFCFRLGMLLGCAMSDDPNAIQNYVRDRGTLTLPAP